MKTPNRHPSGRAKSGVPFNSDVEAVKKPLTGTLKCIARKINASEWRVCDDPIQGKGSGIPEIVPAHPLQWYFYSLVRRHEDNVQALDQPQMNLIAIGILLLGALLLMPSARAAECYVQYDSSKCLAQEAALQIKLTELYAQEEQAMLRALKNYEAEFQAEALKSTRETNSAFASFKDSECYSSPLKEGMSLKDSAVLSDSCRVQWREKRIKELAKRQAKRAK